MPNAFWNSAALLLAGLVTLSGCAGPLVLLHSDLDRDGQRESVSLWPQRPQSVEVSRGGTPLWRGVPSRWRPWKLVLADVDGDGHQEIVVGVHKATRFFPKPHNCLFVYGWDGTRGFPRWLGSSLSKPFSDFAFEDLEGDGSEELVAVELTQKGRYCLVSYSWSGFGFTGRQQRCGYDRIKLFKRSGRLTAELDGKLWPLGR